MKKLIFGLAVVAMAIVFAGQAMAEDAAPAAAPVADQAQNTPQASENGKAHKHHGKKKGHHKEHHGKKNKHHKDQKEQDKASQ